MLFISFLNPRCQKNASLMHFTFLLYQKTCKGGHFFMKVAFQCLEIILNYIIINNGDQDVPSLLITQ